MDVRKKLVEMLDDIQVGGEDFTDYEIYGMRVPDTVSNEDVASHLISNGVTVQEWISVKDRLPEHGDVVLCFMKFGERHILQWDEVSSWWLGYGHGDDWQKADVTNWMRLPDAPEVKND